MNGLITVIVPVYNAEKYLSCCVASILGQSYKDLEVLLVDDGSTDASAALCQEWCVRDGRVRLLRQKNAGVSAARNRGMEEASGEYIAFVDADDWLLPDMLAGQEACLKREGSDMVLGGFREVGKEERDERQGGPGGETALSPVRETCMAETMDPESYVGKYLLMGNTHCWGILFSSRLLKTVRFRTDLTIGEDLMFLVDCLAFLRRVTVTKSREYCYYINEEGAMYSAFRPSYMDQIRCWKLAEEEISGLYPSRAPQAAACLFQAALLTAGKLALLPGTGPGERVSRQKAGGRNDGSGQGAASRRERAGKEEARGGNAGREDGTGTFAARDERDGSRDEYLRSCHEAAGEAWKRLGRKGRRKLPAGYRIKGPVFLAAPRAYLRLYHVWKGRK